MLRTKIILLLTLSFLSSCNLQNQQTENKKDSFVAIEHNYDEVLEYSITWNEIFDQNDETYFVYIYSLTCSHCVEIKNYMIETAVKRKDIYFVKATSKDQITTDVEKTKNAENPGDIWILGYPSLLKIIEKKCVKNIAGSEAILNELK